jgi:TolB-like protein
VWAGHAVVARGSIALVVAAAFALAGTARAQPGPIRPGRAAPPADRAPARPGPTGSLPGRTSSMRIAVLGFDALGMDARKVGRLETLFRMELERLAGLPIPSRRDVDRALRGTRLGRCAGENPCLAAIGKRLAVDLVVSGNVASLGDSYVVNIKVVSAANGAELRRIASDPLRGNPDELIDSVRVAAYRLLAPERLRGAISILADIAGAEVLLDGRRVGRTPLARPIRGLALGPHRLEVAAAGYSRFADEVQVRFQKTTRVVVSLAAEPGRLDLTARPRGPRPAPRRWYDSPWFLIGAGAAAIVIGGVVGYKLADDGVLDCESMPEACR